MTRSAYYRSMARRFAAMAARYRWMRQDIRHELWADRAHIALFAMQLALNDEASRRRTDS